MFHNPYTPPSSNEDSPQPVFDMHHSSPNQYILMDADINFDETFGTEATGLGNDVYLKIVEQPTEKFRFRYRSEMAGTHGSLNGQNSDRTRKQTYPTVQLKNFNQPAIIRCSLYQFTNTSKERQPHAHRLIRKVGNEEVDDPHPCTVGPNDRFEATFHSMGIIHTARKNVVDELVRKKTLLKGEEVARINGPRPLRKDEEMKIKQEAEEESKSINMNIVCLRFDAFVKQGEVLIPICEPVYSHSINNLKSALTGELKIVRMDHSTSPAKGNREIFMLVEKVTKKNIKVRFFELDENESEVWSEEGRFTELDVHHQYAIVFRTPPYRDPNIDSQRTVYVELMRITDNSRSEPREFTYHPTRACQPGAKRKCVSSSSYSYSSGLGEPTAAPAAANFPATLLGEKSSIDLSLSDGLNSSELEQLCKTVGADFQFPPFNYVGSAGGNIFGDTYLMKDGAKEYQSGPPSLKLPPDEKEIIHRVRNEFESFLGTNPKQEMVQSLLVSLFADYLTDNDENALHLLVKHATTNNYYARMLSAWLKVIERTDQLQIVNAQTQEGHTIGHLAIVHDNFDLVNNLCLRYKPDFSLLDSDGNTPLHLAVLKGVPATVVDVLVRSKDLTKLPLDAENNDSSTALQIAVGKKSLPHVRILCEGKANVTKIDKRNGNSLLHSAIIEESEEVVRYLIEHTPVDILQRNYQDMTPYHMAKRLLGDRDNTKLIKIVHLLEEAMDRKGLHTEVYIKEELESEDEMECDFVECKPEKFSAEELREKYRDVKRFTPECLDEVSGILDESGNWEMLLQVLDMQHIVYTDMFKRARSKARQLLQSACLEWEVYQIREFLENIEEHEAVAAVDRMVHAADGGS